VLAAGCDAEALGHRVAQLAARLPAIDAPPLAIARPGGFFALVLSRPCTTVDRLAAPCVAELDTFRAPPGAEELARRRRAGLTPRQERLLEHWGYPFVMDEFRFHMTLTGRLPNEEAAGLRPILERLAAPYCRSALRIDAIGLYRQPRRDAAFRLVRRYPLAGTAA
jgi:hypothetical protein